MSQDLKQAGQIVLAECICRKQKQVVGKGCGKAMEACFMFGSMGQYCLDRGMGRRISMEEGLEVLAQAAEAVTLMAKPKGMRLEPPRTSADQMRYMAQRRALI